MPWPAPPRWRRQREGRHVPIGTGKKQYSPAKRGKTLISAHTSLQGRQSAVATLVTRHPALPRKPSEPANLGAHSSSGVSRLAGRKEGWLGDHEIRLHS